MRRAVPFLAVLLSLSSLTYAEDLTADEIIKRVMLSDPFGFSGAEVRARLVLVDERGSKSELVFAAKSKQYDPPLSKAVLRFVAPPDLAGAAFLQVQKKDGDDDRFLYLPELKRSRRIAGNLRSGAFMGTDFSFADFDRRDIRHSNAKIKGKEKLGNWPCHVLDIVPKSSDSDYSHLEMWVREDNYVPMRIKLYDRGQVLVKTFDALELRRVSGAWFVSKSRMVNHQRKHKTELLLEEIAVKSGFPEEEFSVRALERS